MSNEGHVKKVSKRGLSVILIAGMAAVVIILSTMTAYIGFAEFTAVLEQQYNDSAYEVAETAKTYLNPEKFSQYLDTLEKDEEFELIQQRLDDLTNATDCNFIYVGVVDSNYTSTTYIYDSVNSSLGFDRYPLGYTSKDVDPNYAEDLKHIVETGGRAEKYLYSYGESGAHTSAGLAVKNAEGKVVGIIGVEKTMRVLENARAKYVNHVVTIAAIILVIAVVLYSLYLHRTVISPIKDITNEAERFAEDHQTGSELKAVSSKFEIGVLARSVKKMESDIMQYIDNITKITAEKERISAELNVATQIQADMLPSIFPAFPDRNEFDIYATMNPAKEVGGDFYDFFLIDDDHLAMVMADVSGKGVPAALFMVIAKTIIKNHAQLGELSPAKVLMQANEQLCEGNEAELFVTVWLGILEISTGKGKAANAGHEHPALRRKDGKFELIQYRHSPAVATMDGIRFKEHDFELYPGDTLFVYTDGVAEATDAHNELYGGDRMIDALNKDPNASPKELLATVKKSVDEFVGEAPQFDDITMLGLKYFGAEGNK